MKGNWLIFSPISLSRNWARVTSLSSFIKWIPLVASQRPALKTSWPSSGAYVSFSFLPYCCASLHHSITLINAFSSPQQLVSVKGSSAAPSMMLLTTSLSLSSRVILPYSLLKSLLAQNSGCPLFITLSKVLLSEN